MMKYLLLILFIFLPYVLLSSDWNNVQDLGIHRVESISCTDSNNCFAVVQHTFFTRIYKSTDQGVTWQIINQSDPLHEKGDLQYMINAIKGISPHPDYFYMIFYDIPYIKKSTDGGNTFKVIRLDTITGKEIYDIAMYDSSIGFAISSDWCFITHDGWENIEKRKLFLPFGGYYSPIFFDSNLVVMTYSTKYDEYGNLFVMYKIDKNEWTIMDEFAKEPDAEFYPTIMSIFFINDSLGFGCGQLRTGPGSLAYDLIYRTKDGGHNWDLILKSYEEIPSGLQDISFYDEKNGIAVGQYGKVYLTKDGGDNWVLSRFPDDYNMDTFLTLVVAWAGQHPIVGTWADGIFRYEGDFFDFSQDTIVNTLPIIQSENYDFGTIDISDSLLVVQKIKIHNLSTDNDLIISGFSNLNEWAFTNEFAWLDTMTSITVKPSEFFELPVSFKPDEVRKYIDSIIVYSNAIGQDSIIVLEGEGIDTSTSVNDEFITKKGISISPNPAIEYIEINVQARHAVHVRNEQVQIFNIFGEQMPVEFQNFEPLRIDVSGFPDGMYFLKLSESSKLSESYRIYKFIVIK